MRGLSADLEWRTGFGWSVVLLFVAACLAAIASAGAMRWLAAALAGLVALYAAHRYRVWNGSGWRRVHFRAMRAYAGILRRASAGRGAAAQGADAAHRACVELGLLLCGPHNHLAVETMVDDLSRARGAFLAGIVERHAMAVLPPGRPDLQLDVTTRLRAVPFGPQLVIASVIENVYGGAEAARYALAVATGEADGSGGLAPAE